MNKITLEQATQELARRSAPKGTPERAEYPAKNIMQAGTKELLAITAKAPKAPAAPKAPKVPALRLADGTRVTDAAWAANRAGEGTYAECKTRLTAEALAKTSRKRAKTGRK